MRVSEIFGLRWSDVLFNEGLIAVRAKLKGGKMRYAPMPAELSGELQRFPIVLGEDRIFPPKSGATGDRQRVEGSFENLLERAQVEDFRFHDLRHRADSPIMPTSPKRSLLPAVWHGVLRLADGWKSA
jgi:integrase